MILAKSQVLWTVLPKVITKADNTAVLLCERQLSHTDLKFLKKKFWVDRKDTVEKFQKYDLTSTLIRFWFVLFRYQLVLLYLAALWSVKYI